MGVVFAYVTGEGSEDTIEKIAGVSKQAVEQHSDVALYAMIALIVSGLTSMLGIFFTLRKSTQANFLSIITLIIALVGLGLAARTGYQGGQIRHTELNAAAANSPVDNDKKDND